VRGIGSIEDVQDRLQNAIDIFMHFIVPESQHQTTHGLQNLRPIRFIRRGVLPAVDLDDEMRFGTQEIHDIAVDRHLSPELQAVEPSIAQAEPEDTLGIRLVTAQSSRS
jgi:hypothetical protein